MGKLDCNQVLDLYQLMTGSEPPVLLFEGCIHYSWSSQRAMLLSGGEWGNLCRGSDVGTRPWREGFLKLIFFFLQDTILGLEWDPVVK